MTDKFENNDSPGLGRLEAGLKKLKVPALSQNETAQFYARLDAALDVADQKSGWFGKSLLRWGAAAAAMVIIVGMSFITGMKYGQNGTLPNSAITYNYLATGQQSTDTDSEELDDKYVEMLISSQVQSNGYDISDDLLGSLSKDELQRLNREINVGDLL